MSRLRDDVLRGDYRALYLAWLRAAELEGAGDDVLEPPVPPGLSKLSPPLTSFVELFGLDESLLQAAAEASPQRQQVSAIPPEEAIARLSPAESDEFLVRLARGEPHLSLVFNRRLQELAGTPPSPAGTPRRTWGELQAIR